jgi:hypothetical protein
VTTNDFEIRARLRAQQLTSHFLDEAATRGEAVALERRGERRGLPPSIPPEDNHDEIAVETRVLGRLLSDR